MAEPSRSRVRLRVLADAIGLAMATFLLGGALTTVANLHPGLYPSQDGSYLDGTATVLGCDRVGPVSVHGFGYWWRCRIELALPDGRLVSTTVGHSVVSPDDIGEPVAFREICYDREHEDCVYGKNDRPLLSAASSALQILAVIVAMVGVWLTGVAVYNALLGRRHWWHQTFDRRTVPGS